MDKFDVLVSQRLRMIMERLQRIVREEVGEDLGLALLVFPHTRPGEADRLAEFQYISNTPREHMRASLRVLLMKWDQGMPDVPPHQKM